MLACKVSKIEENLKRPPYFKSLYLENYDSNRYEIFALKLKIFYKLQKYEHLVFQKISRRFQQSQEKFDDPMLTFERIHFVRVLSSKWERNQRRTRSTEKQR